MGMQDWRFLSALSHDDWQCLLAWHKQTHKLFLHVLASTCPSFVGYLTSYALSNCLLMHRALEPFFRKQMHVFIGHAVSYT